jgi:hypothetical protein
LGNPTRTSGLSETMTSTWRTAIYIKNYTTVGFVTSNDLSEEV